MYCTECGQEMPDTAQYCPRCGVPARLTNPAEYKKVMRQKAVSVDDTISIPWIVMAVIVPVTGFVMYAINRKVRPRRAMACLIAGVLGMLMNAWAYIQLM